MTSFGASWIQNLQSPFPNIRYHFTFLLENGYILFLKMSLSFTMKRKSLKVSEKNLKKKNS